jgi:hypothetical protein
MNSAAGHLFDARLHFVSTLEYGYSMAEVVSGAQIPHEGVRFDVFFEGEIRGARVNGYVSGVDYVTLGPNGVSQLHVHARITTDDACHIALHAEGSSSRREGGSFADTRERVTLSTAADRYRWLNQLSAIAIGVADLQAGTIELSVMRTNA